MASILDLISPRDATDYVRELFADTVASLPLNEFFPAVTQDQIKVKFRTNIRTVNPALYRAYDAETPVAKRAGSVEVIDLMLPAIGEKLHLSEEDQHMLLSGGSSDEIVAKLFDDLGNATRDVAARLELSRGDLLTDGVMALPTEDGTLPVDFQTPSSHRPTAATLWSDVTNSTPLTNEQTWITTLATDQLGFGVPIAARTSTRIRNYLLRNAEYRAAFFGPTGTPPAALSPTQLDSVRSAYGLPPIRVDDEIIAGNRVVPDNIFNLIPSNLGQTKFGPTLESKNLQTAGNPHLVGVPAPGLIGVVMAEFDPPTVWTKVAAVGMPLLNDRNRFFAATVA